MSRFGDALRVLAGQRALSTTPGFQSRSRAGLARPSISQEDALRNSVWWACLRLRANLVSTMPVDVVRKSPDGTLAPVAQPGPFVRTPYPGQPITEFLYNTQVDKDRYGNAVGIIRAWDGNNRPAVVELAPMSEVSCKIKDWHIVEWRIGNTVYDPSVIWHEKQYTISGFPLGLSPLAHAAWTLGIYESTQEFALNWFRTGAQPKGVLRNTRRDTIAAEDRQDAKDQFRASTAGGDIFVTGVEWEWIPAQTDAASAGFLAMQAPSYRDVCRFLDVPAAAVDVEISTGNVTYGNVQSFNLQFLITALGPSIIRTETYWSMFALPQPWQFKLNTDALLRLDSVARNQLILSQVAGKTLTPTEARRLDNRPPFTPEDIAELSLFASMGKPAPTAPTQLEAQPWQLPA